MWEMGAVRPNIDVIDKPNYAIEGNLEYGKEEVGMLATSGRRNDEITTTSKMTEKRGGGIT